MFKYDLKAAGFKAAQADQGSVPGCDCGTSAVAFYAGDSGADTNISILNTTAGTPAVFRWDVGWVCRHQSIQGYPQNLGTIDFGQNTKTGTIPELYGIATATYPKAGDYDVTVNTNSTCFDTGAANCSKACPASGKLHIAVAPANAAKPTDKKKTMAVAGQ
jgi:hypothetical protein